MSLQYRTRSRWDDLLWLQRVRLSERLILELVDDWCRGNDEFPVQQTVAALLYIFSPQCDPLKVPESKLCERVFEMVGSAQSEYLQTWPQRSESDAAELIEALYQTFSGAVRQWSDGSAGTAAIGIVNEQVARLIVAKQYVVFHHFETTHRDFGGFYGSG